MRIPVGTTQATVMQQFSTAADPTTTDVRSDMGILTTREWTTTLRGQMAMADAMLHQRQYHHCYSGRDPQTEMPPPSNAQSTDRHAEGHLCTGLAASISAESPPKQLRSTPRNTPTRSNPLSCRSLEVEDVVPWQNHVWTNEGTTCLARTLHPVARALHRHLLPQGKPSSSPIQDLAKVRTKPPFIHRHPVWEATGH